MKSKGMNNGAQVGNSKGNAIARDALTKIGE